MNLYYKQVTIFSKENVDCLKNIKTQRYLNSTIFNFQNNAVDGLNNICLNDSYKDFLN